MQLAELEDAIVKLSRTLDLGGRLSWTETETGFALLLVQEDGSSIAMAAGTSLGDLASFVEGMRKAAYLIKNREARFR